jgi:NADH-quinone oxidoreductase subunit D
MATARNPAPQSDPADLETRDMLLNVGPAHPAMHGIIRIVAKLDGERIEEADVEIGYLHRGFEKMAETVDYNGVIPYTDRLNYVSVINVWATAWPWRSSWGSRFQAAIMYGSSSRNFPDHDHLTCVGASAMELGASSFI